MRAFLAVILIFVISVFAMACGGSTMLAEVTPLPGAAPEYSKPTPPTAHINIPKISSEWTPVSIGSQLGASLTSALKQKSSIALLLPHKDGTAVMEEQIFQMVKAASPQTNIVARGRAKLDTLLEERGEIPYRVTLQQSGSDILGRPVFVPKEHPLNTEWLSKRKPLKGAEAVLAIRPINVDQKRLIQLRKGRKGTCDAAINTLKKGSLDGIQFFAKYKTEADLLLHKAFQRHLRTALPFWTEELTFLSSTTAPGSQDAKCVQAYFEQIRNYNACLEQTCEFSPKLFHQTEGIIGMVDTSLMIPPKCHTLKMRNYAVEIIDLARRSSSEVLTSLDGKWATELVRLSGLQSITRGLTETCTARHRRINSQDLIQARSSINNYLEDLEKAPLTATWELAEGQERIPSIGPVTILGKVRSSGRNPHAEANKLTENLRRLDRCNHGEEKLLQASLIDVGTSQVIFMGIFFEEELLCENLSPAL